MRSIEAIEQSIRTVFEDAGHLPHESPQGRRGRLLDRDCQRAADPLPIVGGRQVARAAGQTVANSDGLTAPFSLQDGDVTNSLFVQPFLKLFL